MCIHIHIYMCVGNQAVVVRLRDRRGDHRTGILTSPGRNVRGAISCHRRGGIKSTVPMELPLSHFVSSLIFWFHGHLLSFFLFFMWRIQYSSACFLLSSFLSFLAITHLNSGTNRLLDKYSVTGFLDRFVSNYRISATIPFF